MMSTLDIQIGFIQYLVSHWMGEGGEGVVHLSVQAYKCYYYNNISYMQALTNAAGAGLR